MPLVPRSEMVQAYRAVGGSRSMRRALVAFLLFSAQEYAIWIAVTLFAFARGGATAAGIVCVAMLLPAALFAPVASVLGDRLPRERSLWIGYAVQAVTAGMLALALWLAPAPVAYLAAIVSACSVTLTRPIHNAILPELANSPEQLTAANSVSTTMDGLGLILGPIVNSVVIALAGPAAVCAISACAMVAAALLVRRLRLHPLGGADDVAPPPIGVESLARDLGEAGAELRRDVPAGALTLVGGGQYFVVGLLDVLYAVLAVDVLGVGEQGAGLLAASVGVGGLIGAGATAVLVGRTRLTTPIELAVGVMAGAMAAVALVSVLGQIMLLLAAVGAARAFFDVAARTLLQRSVRDDVLSRVFGMQEALMMGALAAGSAAAPILVELLGNEGAFIAAGVLAVLAGVCVLPALRILDRRALVPEATRIALLRSIPMFEFLSQPRLESVARSLVPAHVPAGAHVIREGERGDRFYIVATGELVVRSRGHDIAHHGRGDYVGEIALLRDVPRTADVVATTDADLFALDRDDFLSAVTGHTRAIGIADAETDRRLEQLRRLDEPDR